MHFKVSKHSSLLNHNRHFAAHSLFIASINMEKPCLNSPVIGSPLMLTVIMVILRPGITRCPHLSFTTRKKHTAEAMQDELGNGKRIVVTHRQWTQFFEAASVSMWTMDLKAVRQLKWARSHTAVYSYPIDRKSRLHMPPNSSLPQTVAGNSSL